MHEAADSGPKIGMLLKQPSAANAAHAAGQRFVPRGLQKLQSDLPPDRVGQGTCPTIQVRSDWCQGDVALVEQEPGRGQAGQSDPGDWPALHCLSRSGTYSFPDSPGIKYRSVRLGLLKIQGSSCNRTDERSLSRSDDRGLDRRGAHVDGQDVHV